MNYKGNFRVLLWTGKHHEFVHGPWINRQQVLGFFFKAAIVQFERETEEVHGGFGQGPDLEWTGNYLAYVRP